MISIKLQIAIILAALLLLIIVIRAIRAGNIQLKHSILWLFLGLVNLLFALFPEIALYFSILTGIETPVNAMFLVSIIVAYLLILQLSIESSTSEIKNRIIVQKVAILEQDIKEMEEQLEQLTILNQNSSATKPRPNADPVQTPK